MDDNLALEKPKRWAPSFFTIWTGQAFSLLGSQLVSFAIIWWLTKTTGSATILATASLVGLLPQVILGPLTGTLVDRWSRRLTMIIADGLIALATVILAILFALDRMQLWQVMALLFIRSVCGGFHWPAMQASTTLMVPKEQLSRIQGLNQLLQGGMNIASAPLGALLLAVLPMEGILAIDVSTAMLAIIPLFFIQVPQPERRDSPVTVNGKTTFWQDLRAGFSYVWGWPGLMLIGIMATAINFLLIPAFTLLPILVTKHFNGGAIQLATLESFMGIGFITGGLILSTWGGFKRRILTCFTGLLGMAMGCLVMGFLPPSAFGIAIASMLFLGISNPITNGPLLAAVQAAVAPEMQGRVFTLMQSMAAAMSPLGLMIAGPVADKLGVQTWFIIGGIVTGVMGISGFFIPAIMHFEDGRSAGKPAMSSKQPDLVGVGSRVVEATQPKPAKVDYT